MSDKSGFGISAKLGVKTEVPSDASGRLVHAVIDMALVGRREGLSDL
jgi:hypothetical protein